MNKNTLLIAASTIIAASAFTSCTSESAEMPLQQPAPSHSIEASIEPTTFTDILSTRAVLDSEGKKILWTADDEIGVGMSTGTFASYVLSTGAGTSTATFVGSHKAGESLTGHLVYPYNPGTSISGSTLTLNMPSEYKYKNDASELGDNANSSGMPLYATLTSSGATFKHLGGYLVFEIDKIPAGSTSFVFSAKEQRITGDFTVDLSSSEPCYVTEADEWEDANTVTIKFKTTTSESKKLFYVPVPVGTYSFNWYVYKGTEIAAFGTSPSPANVTRGSITRYQRVCSSISTNGEGEGNSGTSVNGHEYVDLGLRSGLKWATMNVGAESPEDYGDYFAWGETEPYYTAGHSQDNPCSSWKAGKSAGYDWPSYKWCSNGDWTGITKYTYADGETEGIWYSNGSFVGDNKTTLELADDAAYKNWGGSWRMPTEAEQYELRTNCTWTWTTQNGVRGYKVSSKTNSNSIFLPSAGYRWRSGLYLAGSSGYYWSSSLFESFSDRARYLFFSSSDFDWNLYREYGHSVRAVCP